MTAKEKATTLLTDLHYEICSKNGLSESDSTLQSAKQCAIILVDEILKLPHHQWMSEKQANEFCNYWKEVKTEIELE